MGCGASAPSGPVVVPEDGNTNDGGGDEDLQGLEDSMAGITQDLDLDQAAGVLSWVERSLKTDGTKQIQDLKIEAPGPVATALLKCSALGTAVSLVQAGVRTLPFGEPVAAALGWCYSQGVKAAKVSRNARQLLILVKSCDRQLASVTGTIGGDPSKAAGLKPDARIALKLLGTVIISAGKLFNEYCQRGALMRLVVDDTVRFKTLDKSLHSAMTQVAFALSMQQMAEQLTRSKYVQDEGAALRAALCKAAGLDPSKPDSAAEALKQLSQTPEGEVTLRQLLRAHLPQHGTVVEQLLAQELDGLRGRVDVVEGRVDAIEITLQRILDKQNASTHPDGLLPKLQAWWDARGWQLKRQGVPSSTFLSKLHAWLMANRVQNGQDVVALFDSEMVEEGFLQQLNNAGEGAALFLELVVMRLLDEDHDGRVTQSELTKLQNMVYEMGRREDVGRPLPLTDTHDGTPVTSERVLTELLTILFLGFDRSLLRHKPGSSGDSAQPVAAAWGVQASHPIQEKLKVLPIIQSYKTAVLMDEYVLGSRQWLYAKVDAWLDANITGKTNPTHKSASRMLLLLAGAGMGKSVFSAVMSTKLAVRVNRDKLMFAQHFFKVGQPRASGKAAILCLVHQLVGSLPGFAEQLDSVIKEHGDASGLSMADTCDKYLIEPLHALAQAAQHPLPPALLLLDAMDEADDGSGRGWQPVAGLLSRKLLSLPPNFHVMVTGRPEVGGWFKDWGNVEAIQPLEKDNLEDMRLVVRAKLASYSLLRPGEDLDAATQVVLDKSKGQFIYVKFALESLKLWARPLTVSQLQSPELLPVGLGGAYSLALTIVQSALGREKPSLLTLMRNGVLPVLAVAQEPLTPAQIAWLAGCTDRLGEVEELLNYTSDLFPLRAAGQDGQQRVFPYHATVLEWLTARAATAAETTGDGSWQVSSYIAQWGAWCKIDWLSPPEVPGPSLRVNPEQGSALAAAACHRVALALPLLDARTDPATCQQLPPPDTLMYTLRHALTHQGAAAAAAGSAEATRSLMLHLGFWQWVFRKGCGPDGVRSLTRLKQAAAAAKHDTTVVADMQRWLRICSGFLERYPQSILQLACDAPKQSIVGQHARTLPMKPQACLTNRPEQWPEELAVLKGHDNIIAGVAMSPCGTWAVTASADRTLRCWDLETGTCKATLIGHERNVDCVCISPDGKTIVSGENYASDTLDACRVWDVESGTCRKVLTCAKHGCACLAFFPDGATLVTGCEDGAIRVLDLESDTCIRTLTAHEESVRSVAVSLDGKVIVSGSRDNTMRIWDAESGVCKHVCTGHEGAVTSVTITQDRKTVVTGSDDCTLRVWDLDTGASKKELVTGHTYNVKSAVFPDGKTVVSASGDTTLKVWDLDTGACLKTLSGHSRGVDCVACSPVGNIIVSGSWDCTLRVWDLSDVTGGKIVHRETAGGSGDHKEQGYDIYDMRTRPDGTAITSSDAGELRVWDMRTGVCKSSQQTQQPNTDADETAGIEAVSPDWSTLALGYGKPTLYVWELEAGRCKAMLRGHAVYVTQAVFTPDGKTLVTGAKDHTLRVWDVDTGECKHILTGHTGGVCVLSEVIQGGKTILSGAEYDRKIRVWDLVTGTCTKELAGCGEELTSLVVSADEATLVTGERNGLIRVWDLASGTLTRTIGKAIPEVHLEHGALALSPDGAMLAVDTDDSTLRLWDVKTGECKSTHPRNSLQEVISTLAARARLFGQQLITTADNGQVMVLARPDGSTALVYVSPPHAVSENGLNPLLGCWPPFGATKGGSTRHNTHVLGFVNKGAGAEGVPVSYSVDWSDA